MSNCDAAVLPPGRQVHVRNLISGHRRRSSVSFTTANMATATKIVQKLRNLLAGVSNKTTDNLKVGPVCIILVYLRSTVSEQDLHLFNGEKRSQY